MKNEYLFYVQNNIILFKFNSLFTMYSVHEYSSSRRIAAGAIEGLCCAVTEQVELNTIVCVVSLVYWKLTSVVQTEYAPL